MSVKELVVEIDGRRLGANELSLLVKVRVLQKLSLPTLCELAFLVGPESVLYRSMKLGSALVVRVATDEDAAVLFEGDLTAREHVYNSDEGPQLRIRGYDKLHRLRKHQKIGAHVNVSLQSLAGALLNDAGVSAAVKVEGSVRLPKWDRLIQSGQTHFDFLQEMCNAVGIYFVLRGNGLLLLTLNGAGEAVPLTLGHTLLEASFEVNGNHTSRKCSALSWNPRRAETQAGSASRPRVGRKVKAEAPPSKLGGQSEFKVPGHPVENSEQADALAQAQLDHRVAGEVTLTGVAAGSPKLRPGGLVSVGQVAAEVAGTYVLTEVSHSMSGEQGYFSEIKTAPPERSTSSRATIAILGRVSNVDDPEGLGRVQVTLPAYEDSESDWMQVVVPGAGKSKGIVALPGIDDNVLVLCANENPAQGFVLGGLYGTETPPDTGVEGGRIQRFSVHTPGGHHLTLDDKQDVLRIEGSKGSYVEFAPNRVILHANAKLDIEAPGKAVQITGASIDFNSG